MPRRKKNPTGLYRATLVDGETMRSVRGTFKAVMAWAAKYGPMSDIYGIHRAGSVRVYVMPADRRMPWDVPADDVEADDG